MGKYNEKQEEIQHMKATGIVRRIDDLGRIVIPKEIRKTLKIREGDPLEIFTDREGMVVLKKYSPVGGFGTAVTQYAQSLAERQVCAEGITPGNREGDAVGAIVFLNREEEQKFGKAELKIARATARFLGCQLT